MALAAAQRPLLALAAPRRAALAGCRGFTVMVEQRHRHIGAASSASSAPPRFGTTEPSTVEMRGQMRELKAMMEEQRSMMEGLLARVDQMSATVERRSSKNLLQAARAITPGTPVCRESFKPTGELVASQVNKTCHLDNDTLLTLAIQGDMFARRERLLREIMLVDGVSWDEAHDTLIEMDEFCEKPYWAQTLPYRLGIGLAIGCAIGSCLLVFSKRASLPYAVNVAGEGLPEGVGDISEMTYNQVGTWTWSWMEPMIGTASFVLLCLQFGRNQCMKMNMHPFTEAMLKWRGQRVAQQYPQYDDAIVRTWAKIMPAVGMDFRPMYKRQMYTPENRMKNYRGMYHAGEG